MEQQISKTASLMEWSDHLSIGHPQIDSQHQILFAMYNNLVNSIEAQVSKELIYDNLRAFRSHAEIHFKTEETYMESIGFPEFDDHRHHHQLLLMELERILDDLRQSDELPDQELLKKLYTWVYEHIAEEDLVIAAFLKVKKALDFK